MKKLLLLLNMKRAEHCFIFLLAISCQLLASSFTQAQNKGTVTIYTFEQSTRENLDSVKIMLYRNDTLLSTIYTDIHGGHDFKNMPAGNYKIKYSRIGYSGGTTTVQLQPGGTGDANIGLAKYKPKPPIHKKR